MSPEEIIADLRDIQPPAALADALPAEFSQWPFVVFAIVVLALVVMWWRRSRLWRRQALERLDILRKGDIDVRWQGLVALSRQVARHRRFDPPKCLFLPPAQIGEAEVSDLDQALERAIGAR
ncbi:MAG: hypothetical protein AAF439_03230 [Pseudomonadota bacterium]